MTFTHPLFSPDGDDLGRFVTAVPNWSAGEEFMTGDGRRFRILEIVAAQDDEPIDARWEIEPTD